MIWRQTWRLCVALAMLLFSRVTWADEAKGFVVVATPGATDIAWPLAGKVYASHWLRPPVIDDGKARVLAGEAGPADLSELAELRAGVKGDDAASREVLAAIAQKLDVRGIIVVQADPPTARLYDATSRSFDAARYEPDASGSWDAAVRSLEKPYLPRPLVTAVPPPAPVKAIKKESKAFYESPWFWVAIGTAALIGGGILIATNIQTNDTVHMQLKMP
jgi:hypothetical protein